MNATPDLSTYCPELDRPGWFENLPTVGDGDVSMRVVLSSTMHGVPPPKKTSTLLFLK